MSTLCTVSAFSSPTDDSSSAMGTGAASSCFGGKIPQGLNQPTILGIRGLDYIEAVYLATLFFQASLREQKILPRPYQLLHAQRQSPQDFHPRSGQVTFSLLPEF